MAGIILKNIGMIDGSIANIVIDNGLISRIETVSGARGSKETRCEANASANCGSEDGGKAGCGCNNGEASGGEGFETLDCTGKVAVPAFANLHTHSGMAMMRGIGEDMELQPWLDHIWEIESKIDERYVYAATRVAGLEMIKTGTALSNDLYWHPDFGCKAMNSLSIRSAHSYTILDGMDPEKSARDKDGTVKLYEESRSWNPLSFMTVGIHSIYTVSEEMILWATEFARKHGLRIHIHVAETLKEVNDCKEAHSGLTPVEYLDSLGVLGPDVISAHSLWLTEHDVELLGRNRVNCVHNINSNAKLASGYKFLWQELAAAGANICIGTDGCASSNNLDILEAMKTTAFFQKAWRDDPANLPVATLMDMATANGAKALGVKSGRIEEGWNADIQLVDTDNTFFLSPAPFLANFIYSAHSDCVTDLICDGKFVMRDRKVALEREILDEGKSVLKEYQP